IRGGVPISAKVEERVRRKLVRRIGHAAPLIERGTIRFDDINGPRGGVDTECRIKLVISGRPSVQAQSRGRTAPAAFARAPSKARRALARVRGKHGLATGRKRTPGPRGHRPAASRAPRRGSPRERAPMKLETARLAPSRKGVKAKARRAKRRVGVQRRATAS